MLDAKIGSSCLFAWENTDIHPDTGVKCWNGSCSDCLIEHSDAEKLWRHYNSAASDARI